MNLWQQYTPELVTDLYEFTMAASYWQEKKKGEATFSLFVRDYPKNRSYMVASGIEDLAAALQDFRIHEQSLAYLASLRKFSPDFLDYLRNVRFTGTLRALPEGTIFFSHEPIVEITAPLIEGQLIETLVMNTIHLETLIATKAARCVEAAQGKGLIDFSLRRTQGVDAGVKVARASYLTGFCGTSNLLAGKLYGIPVYGTMSHSYVTCFEREMESFLAYARTFPEATVLLLDTYDTLSGAEKAVEIARLLRSQGLELAGVRLDSGNMIELSRQVKEIFTGAGFPHVPIIVSGGLDEYEIEKMVAANAPIDLIAIGTRLGVSADAPYLDMAYKLVEYAGQPVLKLSTGKRTWVGRKQVFRFYDQHGKMEKDLLAFSDEHYEQGRPLLETFLDHGQRARPNEYLDTARKRFAEERASLPAVFRSLQPAAVYPLAISERLETTEAKVAAEKKQQEVTLRKQSEQ